MRSPIVCVCALLLAACAGEAGVVDPPGEGAGELVLTAMASDTDVVPGETNMLLGRLVNNTGETVAFSLGTRCSFTLYVRSAAGELVGPPAVCADAVVSYALRPGDVETRSLAWTAQRSAPQNGQVVPLPAGTYRVYAQLDGWRGGAPFTMVSDTVTVTVR